MRTHRNSFIKRFSVGIHFRLSGVAVFQTGTFFFVFCVLDLVCLLCATEPISTSSSHVRYSPDFVCLRA